MRILYYFQSTATPSRCILRIHHRYLSHRRETDCGRRRIISSNSWICANQYPARGGLCGISQRSAVPGDKKLPHFHYEASNVPLPRDISTGVPQPVLPSAWRKKLFDMIYEVLHLSVCALRQLMASKFVWHGLQKQVRQ